MLLYVYYKLNIMTCFKSEQEQLINFYFSFILFCFCAVSSLILLKSIKQTNKQKTSSPPKAALANHNSCGDYVAMAAVAIATNKASPFLSQRLL